jgi:hypothetical protein
MVRISHIDYRDTGELRIALGRADKRERSASTRHVGAVIDPTQLHVGIAPTDGIVADHPHALEIRLRQDAARVVLG